MSASNSSSSTITDPQPDGSESELTTDNFSSKPELMELAGKSLENSPTKSEDLCKSLLPLQLLKPEDVLEFVEGGGRPNRTFRRRVRHRGTKFSHILWKENGECADQTAGPLGQTADTNKQNIYMYNDPDSTKTDEELLSEFPVAAMRKLEEMIFISRWVVPVRPGDHLEVLLKASLELCRRGIDTRSENCQHFFKEGLSASFNKILADDAVGTWKPDIQLYILHSCRLLEELIVAKLSQDWFPLLDLLALLFDPCNKFHIANAVKHAQSTPESEESDSVCFAKSHIALCPKGWLVDLLNNFGKLGGYEILRDRILSNQGLSINLIYALVRPFGQCAEYFTKFTLDEYFVPIIKAVLNFLKNLSNEELKKETVKSDLISHILKYLKALQTVAMSSDTENLDLFRLHMILRMLEVSSFNGKMNALNEINQIIQNVTHYTPHYRLDESESLSAQSIAEWFSKNQVLKIVLRDSLHQPQYVEKLEKILRFIIKEKHLSLADLNDLWDAQVGKHEAIVKNVHDLLAKLAWDFTPEQLDYLFECFQSSWKNASRRQREKLLELIRQLAADDKDGVMAFKVLTLFWNLAHSNEVPTEIMDQALAAHVKVLDYSCSQRDNQKLEWLNRSMDQLCEDDIRWVVPAIKHMREIFHLYPEGSSSNKLGSCRKDVICYMQKQKDIVVKVCQSLKNYMDAARTLKAKDSSQSPVTLKVDGRYSHIDHIRERLHFLKFLLKEGTIFLTSEMAVLIWQSLAENPVFPCDREFCFEWFSNLMGDEPDLDPQVAASFFKKKILNFDPTLLTENGLECIERFFRHSNISEKKLVCKRDEMLMEDLDLTGIDYLWKIILHGSEDIANRAIRFLRLVMTSLGHGLIAKQEIVHEDFLVSCFEKLKKFSDSLLILSKDKDNTNFMRQGVTAVCRVLSLLHEYIVECDSEYGEERAFIPLFRASRGKSVNLTIRISTPGPRNYEDIEVATHFNETPAGLLRQVVRQIRDTLQISVPFKVELYYNGEPANFSDDRRTIFKFGIKEHMIFQATITQNLTNSPDSSEESSTGSPSLYNGGSDGPNVEIEKSLPSVMMSVCRQKMDYLCQLCDLGSTLNEERLKEAAGSLLTVLPACQHTVELIMSALDVSSPEANHEKKGFATLFNSENAVVVYRLAVLHSLLFPTKKQAYDDELKLLRMFFASGGAAMTIEMLTKNNFIPLADLATKRTAYLTVLKLSKAVLAVLVHLILEEKRSQLKSEVVCTERINVLTDALRSIPNCKSESVLRRYAERLTTALYEDMNELEPPMSESIRSLLNLGLNYKLPDIDTIKCIMRFATAASNGSSSHIATQYHTNKEPIDMDIFLCEEALETLTLCFLCNAQAYDYIMLEKEQWRNFMKQLLFYTHSRMIRMVSCEQFFLIATRCFGANLTKYFDYFITELFDILNNCLNSNPLHGRDVFSLLCRLLRYCSEISITIKRYDEYLNSEIEWLRQAKETVKVNGEDSVEVERLEGHVCLARELAAFLTPEERQQLGCAPDGDGVSLIKEILEEFVFPWSRAYSDMKRTGEITTESPQTVCNTPATEAFILDLVVALCTESLPNLKYTTDILTQLFNYSLDGDDCLTEWEYIPPSANRPSGGFVGLKNAGATCYMNSVLQQLFMVEKIKVGILGYSIPDNDVKFEDDNSSQDRSMGFFQKSYVPRRCFETAKDDRKIYNITILNQVQSIFGHLAMSKLQYYSPCGLWKYFRLQGEFVNLKEQQDAVEFFMSLVESVDDGLKALGKEQIMSKYLGGLFSDQKICKECPHRYSKEEPFSVISVDIRNHSNLLDSLEHYVKGELLEGADAYHCERCNKKVKTVKRLCVKRLPPVLAIQLKRFEYDYERLCPIKFNDCFEFPRELDMEPYTVQGLARMEGETFDAEDDEALGKNICSTYRLTGVVVHSGQASGGHYYSYICHKSPDGLSRWYKFDDGDVSECRMDDDEELRNQCFGGDYNGEVFDQMMKRMSFRRQKRWWNAYILFYTQTDELDSNISAKFADLSLQDRRLKIPSNIEKNVLRSNIEFMHFRSHFSQEYFEFVRSLVMCNARYIRQKSTDPEKAEELEQVALTSIRMLTQFLFSVGFRAKRNLRGQCQDWFEPLKIYLEHSKNVRFWFASHGLFKDQCRIGEYLLECPSAEVRQMFAKTLVWLAHNSKNDGIYVPTVPIATLSRSSKKACLGEYILEAVLNLLRREVSEHGRNLTHYFQFFCSYAQCGPEEKLHLLTLGVPASFIQVLLEEGPTPPIKHHAADLSKLYLIVSNLIRCYDISSQCASQNDEETGANPFKDNTIDGPLAELPSDVASFIYVSSYGCTRYIKKVLEEAFTSPDTHLLLQFLSWENMQFSQHVIGELLYHINDIYTQDTKVYLEILISLLRIEDSWQYERISCALKTVDISDDKEGLIDIIYRNRQSHPKRSYIFLKYIVNLMDKGSIAYQVVSQSQDLYDKWNSCIEWLQNELENRRHSNSIQNFYGGPNWPPPSNENINGSFFIERSSSAKFTLNKLVNLRIDPKQTDDEDPISSDNEDQLNGECSISGQVTKPF